MRPFLVRPVSRVEGQVILPGDKSIAHRCIILSAIAKGNTKVCNFPFNNDCLTTVKVLQELGAKIILDKRNYCVTVFGRDFRSLRILRKKIFFGDSGTTFRLLLGFLASGDFTLTLQAGKSLSKRPMRRVVEPLRRMGAKVYGLTVQTGGGQWEEYPPVTIKGGKLHPITYKMPVASAQVKSAILLAGLHTEGLTKIIEPFPSRDHTERMLKAFKADIKINGSAISLRGNKALISPGKIYIPADASSAAFFIVLVTILPGSKIIIKNACLNPLRLGALRVLKRMGAKIGVTEYGRRKTGYEPMGDIIAANSRLKGTRVTREEVPSLIDELPVLMVAACFAKGKTIFEGVQELRVKETDRIRSVCENLKKMGGKIEIVCARSSEKIIVHGTEKLKAAKLHSFSDHRTAMSMIVAGLKAEGNTTIDDISCISKSFPDFIPVLKRLTAK